MEKVGIINDIVLLSNVQTREESFETYIKVQQTNHLQLSVATKSKFPLIVSNSVFAVHESKTTIQNFTSCRSVHSSAP